MSGTADLLAFAGVMALAQFSPGPDMLLLTRTALRSGVRAGVEMAIGIACGLAVHAALAVAGLALVFESFPALWQALRWAGAAYLLWLACGIARAVFTGGDAQPIDGPYARQPFVRGLLCNLLNPKVALVLAAVCAPFLRGNRPEWWPLALWAIVVGQGCVLWSLWARLLQWPALRRRYESARRWLDAAFAMALVALAVRLALG